MARSIKKLEADDSFLFGTAAPTRSGQMPLRVYEGTLTHMLKARDIENTGIDISSFLYEQIKPLFPDAEHVDLTCGENLYNASIYMTPQKVKDQRILSVKLNKECLTLALYEDALSFNALDDLAKTVNVIKEYREVKGLYKY